MENKNIARDEIANGNLSQAITVLNKGIKDSKKIKELNLIESRFQEIQRRERGGLLSNEESMRLRSQIADSLLSFLENENNTSSLLVGNKQALILGGILIILLSGLFFKKHLLTNLIIKPELNNNSPFEGPPDSLLTELDNRNTTLGDFSIEKSKREDSENNNLSRYNSTEIESNLKYDEYYRIAISKMEIKDYQGAIINLTKSISHNPKFSSAFSERGFAKRHIGDYQGSISDYSKAIDLDRENSNAYLNRSVLFFILGNFDSSIKDAQIAVSLNPNLREGYNSLGNSYLKKLKYDLAKENYQKSIEIDPLYAHPFYGLGLVSLIEKDTFRACDYFTKSMNLGSIEAEEVYKKLCR